MAFSLYLFHFFSSSSELLKKICQIEHTRHHSVDNYFTNLLAGLIAYNLLPQKSLMNIEIIDKSNLIVNLILNSR